MKSGLLMVLMVVIMFPGSDEDVVGIRRNIYWIIY